MLSGLFTSITSEIFFRLPLANVLSFATNVQFQACKGLTGIYVTRVQPVPPNEVYHLFSVRKKSPDISEGMWARIKSGNYKGDLAQVLHE